MMFMDDVDIKARRQKQAAYKAELDAQINAKNHVAATPPPKERVTNSNQNHANINYGFQNKPSVDNTPVYIAPIQVSKPNVFQENLTSQIKTIFSNQNTRTFISPLSSPIQYFTFQDKQLTEDFSFQFRPIQPKFVPQDPKVDKIRPIQTDVIRMVKMSINEVNIPQPLINYQAIEEKSHTYTPRCGFTLRGSNFEFQSNKQTPQDTSPRESEEDEADQHVFPNDLPYF
ncbi:hypothetical protein TVAG_023820 [Trichomonas vaginalis G3]|uniref:Uncharacterized protein n=1 Tax=Trichomonas vaginalis (strain ATCC PRA-98 / G3) TaxID=412133 RepID=A2G046_TRIV3|nr:hypothetical protein TVAGG3_0769670 [Trichomonas vaginalis G3]EAX89469.1 hypothetical protein TVAG_023820 [Trichomonas vaginalis G3]KAI5513745.1 hypothetical protein TVAGG3_0769670 [Trichomonas vaginalis G3]|eukprot:XP_001302399.1 hypothetical protein [Trichomonas vaginalis G3]